MKGNLLEVGRLDSAVAAAGAVPLRKPNEVQVRGWDIRESGLADALVELSPDEIGNGEAAWPSFAEESEGWAHRIEGDWKLPRQTWAELGIRELPEPVDAQVWPVIVDTLVERWMRGRSKYLEYTYSPIRTELLDEGALFPVVVRGGLKLVSYEAIGAVLDAGAELLPPTMAGWCRFLDVLPAARKRKGDPVAFAEAEAAGKYWWARSLRTMGCRR